MRTTFPKALVLSPSTEYGNAHVDVEADDDVTMTLTVNNRQGVTLARFTGSFEPLGGGGWVVHDATGDVTVQPQAGCGCGGTSVNPRMDPTQVMP